MTTRRKTRPVPTVIDASTTLGPEDAEGLPQIFKLFAGEVRDSLARIEKIIPSIARIELAIADIRGSIRKLDDRVYAVEQRQTELERGRHDHEARIAMLESLRPA